MDVRLREEVYLLHAQVCGALADPNRILLLYTLATGPHNVNDLAEILRLPQPTISRHLKTLRERGMVLTQREGRTVFYSLADRRIVEALDLLRAVLAERLESQVALVHSMGDSCDV